VEGVQKLVDAKAGEPQAAESGQAAQ